MPGESQFPPIGEYGFLSDCETTALVAPSGNVEWLCLPRMDSASVFGAILDRSAGGFRLGPEGMTVPAARRYLPGTMVLETSWATPTGWLVIRDALLMGPWHHEDELSRTHRRTPTDYDADHVLLRSVRCMSGEVQVTLDCEPVFDYGRVRGEWTYTDQAYGQGVCRAPDPAIGVWLTLTTDMRLGFESGRAMARTLIREGETHFCALSWTEHGAPQTYEEAKRRLVWTAHHWQHWLARGRFPDHPWTRYLQRSALTLKGLTFAPSGALVAAPTTSLPEHPGGQRNWDYRYCWLRDSAFTLWSLYTLGFDWEAGDFFWFVADLAQRDSELQVMYGVDGERDLSELTLDHLSGYEGARPVRAGNAAYSQRQHDPDRELGPPRRPDVGRGEKTGRVRSHLLAGTGLRHVGGARPGQAFHLLQAHVLVGGAAGGAGGARPRRGGTGQDLAGGGGRHQRGHPHQRRGRTGGVHPALRHHRAGRVVAAAADDGLPAAR
jgi:GH15 family glucan-1,4-alpha-glucosidase